MKDNKGKWKHDFFFQLTNRYLFTHTGVCSYVQLAISQKFKTGLILSGLAGKKNASASVRI